MICKACSTACISLRLIRKNGHIRSILLWKNGQLHLIVFHNGNVSTSEKITYLPIYMLMFVERQRIEGDLIYKLDLGVLQGE